MQRISEEEALRQLDKIYANLKSELVHEMQKNKVEVSDICYDMQLTEEQFIDYLGDKSDVGFCVDMAKSLVKTKKPNVSQKGEFYGKDN